MGAGRRAYQVWKQARRQSWHAALYDICRTCRWLRRTSYLSYGMRVPIPACALERACRLVTYGQNHIKFWRVGPDPRGPAGSLNPTSESGVYALGKTHSVLSAAFLPSGIVLTGKQS